MKETIGFGTFQDRFAAIRPDNFTYEGLRVLFEYLEECEGDTGQEYELDVIALCCEFSEDSDANIASSYSIDIDGMDEESAHEAVREFLMNEGVDIGEVEGGFVYRDF